MKIKFKHLPFVLIIQDYCGFLNPRRFIWDFVLPLAVSLLTLFSTDKTVSTLSAFLSGILNISGVAVGFVFAAFTLVATGSGEGIQKLKATKSMSKRYPTSLHQVVLASLTYSLYVNILVVVLCIVLGLYADSFKDFPVYQLLIKAGLLFFFLHSIAVVIRIATGITHALGEDKTSGQ